MQPDTIVPEPGNPQALNRYAYVFNNPLKYTDPSGRCPWCVAALGGAILGGGMSWLQQTWANHQQGMSWRDAALTVDIGEIAGAAVAGAIVAGTFGAAAVYVGAGSVAGIGFWGTVGLGAGTNVVANQASPLVRATVNEAVGWLHNRGDFSTADIMQMAHSYGFLDPAQIGIDAASGAIAGAVAYPVASALTRFAQGLGLVDQTIHRPIWTVQFAPGGGLTATAGRSRITIPADVAKGYLIILGERGPDAAARWLFNQIRTQISDQGGDVRSASSP